MCENIWDDTQTVANAQKRIEELEAKCKKMEDALKIISTKAIEPISMIIATKALGDIK